MWRGVETSGRHRRAVITVPGQVATPGELHRLPGWTWVHCTRYAPLNQHRAPMALSHRSSLWGPDTSGNVLPAPMRRVAREVRPQGES